MEYCYCQNMLFLLICSMARKPRSVDSPAPDERPVLRCARRGPMQSYHQQQFITDHYVLVWIEAGTCTLHSPEGGAWQLQRGDAFKRLPDKPLDVFFDKGCITRYVAVPATVCPLLAACAVPDWDGQVMHPGSARSIVQRFERLRQSCYDHAGTDLMQLLSQMQVFIADLHRRAASPQHMRWLDQACELLRADALTVPAIADACAMPYSTFRMRFHKEMSCSPNAYRIRCRMQRAQLLLSEGWTLTAIAEELHYSDAFRLSAQFKQHCGLSPRAWKREQGLM